MADILSAAIQLRQQAWEVVQASAAFAQFRALDAAIVEMGGSSILPATHDAARILSNPQDTKLHENWVKQENTRKFTGAPIGRKVSHAEAAYFALAKAGHPLQSVELLEAARNEGAKIGGEKPIVNLTSTLSRNDGFINVRFDGVPHWWLSDRPLPYGWVAQSDDGDDAQSMDISSMFGEKGGDDDGAAIDDLIG